MARWKLTEKHYILTDPPTEWEHQEQDLMTGVMNRKRFVVPKHLNPEEPRDQNYKETGEIIVCHKGKGQPRDIVMIGPPTPGMEPLDDEAAEISAAARVGEHPIESMPTRMDGVAPDTMKVMQSQINTLMLANDELQRRMKEYQAEALPEVEPTVEELTASEKQAAAAQAAMPKAKAERRV